MNLFVLRTLACVLVAGCAPEDGSADRPPIVPDWAEEIAPNVYDLGTDVDPVTGEEVTGVMFVDDIAHQSGDATGQAKGGKRGAPPPCWAGAGGAAWLAAEDWGLDPDNASGIADSDIQTVFATAMATWEAGAGVDIFGNYNSANTHTDVTGLDGENNVRFGDTGGSTIVAVTSSWWPTSGKPDTRHLYEWDAIFADLGPDGLAHKWFTVTGEAYYFDLENTAAHEFGHALGLAHPDSSCTEETMYGGLDIGETKKRDLNTGDITGVTTLY